MLQYDSCRVSDVANITLLSTPIRVAIAAPCAFIVTLHTASLLPITCYTSHFNQHRLLTTGRCQ
jgi:hypothetical protein